MTDDDGYIGQIWQAKSTQKLQCVNKSLRSLINKKLLLALDAGSSAV